MGRQGWWRFGEVALNKRFDCAIRIPRINERSLNHAQL